MKRILYIQNSSSAHALAEACLCLTPKVSLYRDKELYLEISQTQKFFGGEAGILFQWERIADTFPDPHRQIVVTDKPEWAKALAISPENIWAPGKSRELLYLMSIDRLEFCGDPATLEIERAERLQGITFLRKVGFKSIGEFAALDASSTSKRFGKWGVLLREWVQGTRELSLRPFIPTEVISEKIDTDEIISLDALLFSLRHLLVRIENRLRGRSLVARELSLIFFLESGNQLIHKLKLAEPMQESNALIKILQDFLPSIKWDSPLSRLTVEVSDSAPFTHTQLSLFEKTENRLHELAQFVARLRARYFDCAGTPELRESFLPEKCWKNVWPPPKPKSPTLHFSNRPIFFYDPPKAWQPKGWKLSPSENVWSEWWEEQSPRQYFFADNAQGERLWVYVDEKTKQWFLQGVFD